MAMAMVMFGERHKVRTLASGRASACMSTRARVRDMI
jgi:hypothetical protein